MPNNNKLQQQIQSHIQLM